MAQEIGNPPASPSGDTMAELNLGGLVSAVCCVTPQKLDGVKTGFLPTTAEHQQAACAYQGKRRRLGNRI